MNDLVVFERQLEPLLPRFEQALAGVMPVARLARTILISVERAPKLLQCDRQSLLNAAMTFACLALEVDGITGQGYLLQFKGRVQPVIGYKGYNTLGARGRITINGRVVREGDAFDYRLGTGGFVHHTPKLNNTGRIVAAWATAEPADRPPTVEVLGIDEIMAVMERSPAVRVGAETPWRDTGTPDKPGIGFPAMAAKTAKRRLSRSLPLTVFQYAARMEEIFEEQGKLSWITPERGVIVEGAHPLTETEPSPTPTVDQLIAPQAPIPHAPQPAVSQPAPETAVPGAGAADPESPFAIVGRLKRAIDGLPLGDNRAHADWARENTGTLRALPMKLQHEVINHYEAHKARAAG